MINITPSSAKAIKQKLSKRENKNAYLRLGVKGSGCSGMMYVIEFDDEMPREKDIAMMYDTGIQVVVDNKSIKYLDGMTLDYSNNLMKQGFEIKNPNEASRCGCGKSFEPKQ